MVNLNLRRTVSLCIDNEPPTIVLRQIVTGQAPHASIIAYLKLGKFDRSIRVGGLCASLLHNVRSFIQKR